MFSYGSKVQKGNGVSLPPGAVLYLTFVLALADLLTTTALDAQDDALQIAACNACVNL